MKMLRFREVKRVSNHTAGTMQSWALNLGQPVPEASVPSGHPSSSDAYNPPGKGEGVRTG